ncbi:MAG: hypothetical protein IPJ65_22645 [Archangiaceae bacterium]|nr:hypothetical protein [Archangiaceae bacterium]
MSAETAADVWRLLSIVGRGLPRTGHQSNARLLLWLMARFPGINAERLGRVMQLKPAGVWRLQGQLVRSGLLSRELRLTARGRTEALKLGSAEERVGLGVLGRLPRAKLDGARSVLMAVSLALAGANER